MRPATVIALGILLLFLFGAFIIQFVVIGTSTTTEVGPDTVAYVTRAIIGLGGAKS